MTNSLVSFNMLSAFLFVLLAGSAVFAQNSTSSAAVTVDNAAIEDTCSSVGVDRGSWPSWVNALVDEILCVVKIVLISDGFDPLKRGPFEINLLGGGFVGRLELHNCELYNLSTIYRTEDAETKDVNSTLQIKSALGFGDLELHCDYKIFLLTFEVKKGKVVVDIPHLTAELSFDFNLGSQQNFHLQDLKLANKGPIDVHLEGGITDVLLSLVTEAITNILLYFISSCPERQLGNEIRKIFEANKINGNYDLLKTIPE